MKTESNRLHTREARENLWQLSADFTKEKLFSGSWVTNNAFYPTNTTKQDLK